MASELDTNAGLLLGLIVALMVLNWLAMLYARQILNVLNPTKLQVTALVLGIIQLALGMRFIIQALELQSLVIQQLLSS